MSIAATKYITSGGKDLSSIFMPLSFGTQYPTETGYKLSTGADLNTVFCSKYSTTATNTSLLLSNNQDLSDIFDGYHPTGYINVGIVNPYVNAVFTLDPSNVYIGGGFTDTTGNYITRWDGTQFNKLGNTPLNFKVRAIYAVDTSNVYIGGGFTNGSTIGSYITRWDGIQYNSLGTTQLGNAVNAIYAVDTSNVYIGGDFTNATIGPRITRWDGIQYNSLPTTNPLNSSVKAIYAFDTSNVYIGGAFSTATISFLAKWNGTVLDRVGVGPQPPQIINGLHKYNNSSIIIGLNNTGMNVLKYQT